MTGGAVLAALSVLMLFGAARELLATYSAEAPAALGQALDAIVPQRATAVAAGIRLGVPRRLARAGLTGRLSVWTVMAGKLAGAALGLGLAFAAAPAAPARLSLLVAGLLPLAGFLAPDALLERAARRRSRLLVGALPEVLDMLAVGAAAGRGAGSTMAEIAAGTKGPLATELGVCAAELDSGLPQARALEMLRKRAGCREVGALVAAVERSRRYGSPLADQLRGQATALRREQRRWIEEEASRAAPKIQLVVALVLVPSVLLMIAAALLANSGRLLAGF